MLDAGLDEVGRAEVGLVAERDEAGEPVSACGQEAADFKGHVAALRQQRNPPGGQRVRRKGERGAGVEHTEAVRTEQHRARGSDPFDDAVLKGAPLGAELGEPRGDADDRPCTGSKGVVDGFLEAVRGHGHDHQVHRLVELGEAAQRGPAEDRFATPVDQVHGAGVRHPDGLHAQPVAVLGLVVARPQYRNGFRVEERGEVADHDCGS